jgi:K+-transporting ATPase A subunit
MTVGRLLTLASVMLALLALTPLVGGLIYRSMEGSPTPLTMILGPVERAIYRVGRIDATLPPVAFGVR